jgi:hypothetical protein
MVIALGALGALGAQGQKGGSQQAGDANQQQECGHGDDGRIDRVADAIEHLAGQGALARPSDEKRHDDFIEET